MELVISGKSVPSDTIIRPIMRGDTPNAEAILTECPTAFSAEKAKRVTPKIKSAIPIVKSKANHNPIKRTEATPARIKISLRSLNIIFYLP
jgi:hypothetical protein